MGVPSPDLAQSRSYVNSHRLNRSQLLQKTQGVEAFPPLKTQEKKEGDVAGEGDLTAPTPKKEKATPPVAEPLEDSTSQDGRDQGSAGLSLPRFESASQREATRVLPAHGRGENLTTHSQFLQDS